MNAAAAAQERQIQSILGQATNVGKVLVQNAVEKVSSPETGSYLMKVLFYLLFYAFVIFIILMLVHFTITPVFRFTPDAKGYIGVPGTTDSKVYWAGTPPAALDSAPDSKDEINAFKFENKFSFSIDIMATKLSDTDSQSRLVLFKTFDFDNSGRDSNKNMSSEQFKQLCGYNPDSSTNNIQGGPSGENTQSYMANASSMIIYITETNDLVVTFFVGPNGTVYNSRPIRNIPLNEPFRVTVVVEEKLFTVYLNGKQTFQRIVSEGIRLNSVNGMKTDSQRFYAPPSWAEQPKKSIYIQNLILWPRMISYSEVVNASPALATADSFGVGTDMQGASCS
jgi:hypothetical protein